MTRGTITWLASLGRRRSGAEEAIAITTRIILPIDGPFSLAAAASFGFGPNTGRPHPDGSVMRLVFVADDFRHHVGAVLTQLPDGSLAAEIDGAAPVAAAEAQVRRILSIDTGVDAWLAAGRADPVLGGVQAAYPGLRPVLFNSPYEAAAWSVLSQRRHRAQATALRRRLSEAAGALFDLAGQPEPAFPLPEQLLEVTQFPGIEDSRLARLHDVAKSALDGRLDAAALRAVPHKAALADLQRINGLGPFYATLVYLRSTGVTDALTLGEPRLADYLQHYYDLPDTPGAAEITRIAERWRPFRTWAAVLFRVAGEGEGVPFAQRQPRRPARRPVAGQ
jgi:DNA-3-methyladenine glycosylase II